MTTTKKHRRVPSSSTRSWPTPLNGVGGNVINMNQFLHQIHHSSRRRRSPVSPPPPLILTSQIVLGLGEGLEKWNSAVSPKPVANCPSGYGPHPPCKAPVNGIVSSGSRGHLSLRPDGQRLISDYCRLMKMLRGWRDESRFWAL